MDKQKINSFTDLTVWRQSHILVLEVYKLVSTFPSYEQLGLSNQLRRASVSVTSNIAEGFARHSKKEKIQFYYLSLGSLSEIQNQLLIAKDLHYCSSELFQKLAQQTVVIAKLFHGLIKSLKNS